jgi:glycosyltransferase involved in cell wall biosynthesis
MINSLGFGGAERVIADLSVHLAKRGMKVFLFLMDDSKIAYPYGGTIVPISFTSRPLGLLTPLMSWQHLVKTAAAKKKHKIDVTISAMEYLNFINLWTGHDRRIATLHNYRFQQEVTPTAKDRFIEKIFTRFAARNRAIVCVSRAIEEKARALYPGVDIKTIYNSVDLAQVTDKIDSDPQLPMPIPLGAYTFVHAGRLSAQKAQDRLLRAFARVYTRESRARLLILGGGEEEGKLKALAGALGIAEAVHFTGFVDNPFYYVSRCRAFVLSSEYEGFGNVIIEALACGTPVLSTDCKSGPREILSPHSDIHQQCAAVEVGEYGLLTALDDESLASGMEMLLRDEAMHARFAQTAKARARDFAADGMINHWLDLLKKVMA